jgi:hypothetical protein
MTQGIERKNSSGNLVDDYDAICRVLKLLSEGEAKGDLAKMTEAFHADAWLFGHHPDGTRRDIPVVEHMSRRATLPTDAGTYRLRVTSVQQTGDAAMAVVAEDGAFAGDAYVSYVLLARIDHSWKVVSYEFEHTVKARPEAAL